MGLQFLQLTIVNLSACNTCIKSNGGYIVLENGENLGFQNQKGWIAGTIGFEIVCYFMRLKVVISPNIEGLVYNFC